MALRPPLPRRRRSNPFNRSLPVEAIGLISGFLIASMAARTIALVAGLEQWTTTWSVIHALTVWVIWPLDLAGVGQTPQLVGLLRPVDAVAAAILILVALFLLATRTFTRRAF